MQLGTGSECVNLKEFGWVGYGTEALRWPLVDEDGNRLFQPDSMTAEEIEHYINEEYKQDWYPIPYPDPLDNPLYDPNDH